MQADWASIMDHHKLPHEKWDNLCKCARYAPTHFNLPAWGASSFFLTWGVFYDVKNNPPLPVCHCSYVSKIHMAEYVSDRSFVLDFHFYNSRACSLGAYDSLFFLCFIIFNMYLLLATKISLTN